MKYTLLFVLLFFSSQVFSESIKTVEEYFGLHQDSKPTIVFFDEDLKGACTVKLYNPEGKLIIQNVVNAVRHRVSVSTSGLKRGVHTLEVINGGKSYWKKVELK